MKKLSLALLALSLAAHAQNRTGLCMLTASTNQPNTASFVINHSDCEGDGPCGTSNSNMSWQRWSITSDMLTHEGAQVDARVDADAGEMRCNGIVHDGVLSGRYTFTPNLDYARQVRALGLEDGIADRKFEGLAMLDVSIAWIKRIQATGVTGLSANRLLGLRALHVEPEYIHALAAAGYPELRANKLTEMKAVGVTPDRIREIKAMGFNPSDRELIQICVFHIDKAFVDRMKARGMTDLTVAKLVKIKTFKLDE
ncbi:hypothetical protein [Terriglobus tenax]|uniref:hypothetical protein n=1 Tax=Terriglobus tenax TaxID=1111115 RepID=UPI0021E009C9|nr:hypothetical protein [Terriglobus tenax]